MDGATAAALGQAWPPFVLVAGLLLVGAVVDADGLFAAVGARAEGLRVGAAGLLVALLLVDAVVAAILNLDTAVAFVTPTLVHAAHRRGCDARPFVYGALLVANAASILLPGSNLTNLIVLAEAPIGGGAMLRAMALPWLLAVAATIAYLVLRFRPRDGDRPASPPPPLRLGVGAAAAAASAVLVVAAPDPALPVLAVGLLAIAARRVRPRIGAGVLVALLALSTALGTLARTWSAADGLAAHGPVASAAIGAGASVLVNNLPAATLLSATPPAHPLALLIGLGIGPNLAVTGSLASFLWLRAARAAGAQPSLLAVSAHGVVVAPVGIAVALLGLWAGAGW